MRIAVIGIGQSLRGDDAVGLEAVRQWQAAYPETANLPNVKVDVQELPGLALLDLLNGSDAAILVDAVKSSSPPGTIHRLDIDQLASFRSDSKSAHGWGVAETLQLDRLLNPLSRKIPIRLIGVEAEQFELGKGLSEVVTNVLPQVCKIIQEEIQLIFTS